MAESQTITKTSTTTYTVLTLDEHETVVLFSALNTLRGPLVGDADQVLRVIFNAIRGDREESEIYDSGIFWEVVSALEKSHGGRNYEAQYAEERDAEDRGR